MKSHLLFLGTGGSLGIPVIGCNCSVCLSKNPKNKRFRASVLLKTEMGHYLIDAGPDVRMQLLYHRIDTLDGLLLTHFHHDHTAGLDELRAFYIWNKKPLACLLSSSTYEDIKKRFYYMFTPHPDNRIFVPHFDIQVLPKKRGALEFQGLNVHYTSYHQLDAPVNGFRIGNFAYVSDIKDYEETIFEDLKGIKILIISALRHNPSPMHLTVDDAIQFSKRIGAKETWFTHIAHELDHDETNAALPSNIRLAHDGLEIEVEL